MILVPKRKLVTGTPVDQPIEAAISHTTETVITTMREDNNKFDWELKIPCGTDMYPGGH